MSVRRLFAGVATTSLVAASWAIMAPAQADPSAVPTLGDVVGVGSDTTMYAVSYLADGRDGIAGYNVGRSTGRIMSFDAAVKDASGTQTNSATVVLQAGHPAVTRPNGSGAGKGLLYGPGNNPDVDFARSSSAINAAEKTNGLFAFPFAKDNLALATATASNAPATISPTDMVRIYSGAVTNWSQLGGSAGAIAPKIPQTGSGTRDFFVAQLKAANGGADVTLAPSVTEVQEHDDTPIKSNPNAVAPFSVGRAGLLGTLRMEGGFAASRALYNVVRQGDVAKPEITAIFGESGFVCSPAAKPLIAKAGFEQLLPRTQGGACGVPTQDPTTNLAVQQVTTSTTVSGTSAAAGALRLSAKVGSSSAPDGIVSFFIDGAAAASGSAVLTGGTATKDLTGLAAGNHTVVARFVPSANSVFTASESSPTTVAVLGSVAVVPPQVVKATSKVAESFKSKVKHGKRAKGVITIKSSVAGRVATGKVVIKLKKKVVGKGTLKGGKVTIKLKPLPKGKNKLKVTYVSGAATIGGSTKTFTIKQL
ncbi:substrate-binding domain-containing protein [Nocardioides sp. LHG3406-4]|uniref:substrate-binding domain-containing protein n=1 Tax=Nocardioides sp. LHG3406-4 TaxID=2804575 RepID=UPI003CE827A0